MGFKSLINNRPDEEQHLVMTSAETEGAAHQHQLVYRHIPLKMGTVPDDKTIQAFADAVQNLPKPIFAHCKSGARSAALWAFASVSQLGIDAIIETCNAAGFNFSALRPVLEMRAERLKSRS